MNNLPRFLAIPICAAVMGLAGYLIGSYGFSAENSPTVRIVGAFLGVMLGIVVGVWFNKRGDGSARR